MSWSYAYTSYKFVYVFVSSLNDWPKDILSMTLNIFLLLYIRFCYKFSTQLIIVHVYHLVYNSTTKFVLCFGSCLQLIWLSVCCTSSMLASKLLSLLRKMSSMSIENILLHWLLTVFVEHVVECEASMMTVLTTVLDCIKF